MSSTLCLAGSSLCASWSSIRLNSDRLLESPMRPLRNARSWRVFRGAVTANIIPPTLFTASASDRDRIPPMMTLSELPELAITDLTRKSLPRSFRSSFPTDVIVSRVGAPNLLDFMCLRITSPVEWATKPNLVEMYSPAVSLPDEGCPTMAIYKGRPLMS